jgi:hypothetical protein
VAIQVVEAYPDRGGGRRAGRFVMAVVGVVLLLIGLIALGLTLAVVAAVVIGAREGDSEGLNEALQALALFGAIAVVGLWLGMRAVRGRRRLGLFLRRFGYLEATRTMSGTVAGQTGRMWRMVTLDDANIAPQGTARRNRRVTWWLAAAAFALAGFCVVSALTSEEASVEPTGDVVADIVGTAIAGFVQILVLIFVFMFALVVVVIGVAAGAASRAARAAAEQASVVIDSPHQVSRAAARIRRNNRRVFGARLVVARVATPLWQDVVRHLAAVSDAVVIDVSHATDNLLWEVENMRSPGRPLVLVCHRDRIATLLYAGTAPAGAPGGAAPADVRLAHALDGHEVLVYGSGEAEQRAFARSLRNRLAAV